MAKYVGKPEVVVDVKSKIITEADPNMTVAETLKSAGIDFEPGSLALMVGEIKHNNNKTLQEIVDELKQISEEKAEVASSTGFKIQRSLIEDIISIYPELGQMNGRRLIDVIFTVLESQEDLPARNNETVRVNLKKKKAKAKTINNNHHM